jgi:hypothetical protein
VPARGDDDISEGVGRAADVEDLVRGRVAREVELEETDGVAPVGHRHDHPGAVVDGLDVRPLRAEHAFVQRARQRKRLGLFRPRGAGALDEGRGGQPDHRPPAEVGDQQRHGVGVDHAAELGGHHLDGVDGSGLLDLLEKCADVDHETLRLAHGQTLGAREIAGIVEVGHETAPPGRRQEGGPAAPGKT